MRWKRMSSSGSRLGGALLLYRRVWSGLVGHECLEVVHECRARDQHELGVVRRDVRLLQERVPDTTGIIRPGVQTPESISKHSVQSILLLQNLQSGIYV